MEGRYNWPCLNTFWERVLEQDPGVERRDDNLSELSIVERKCDDTEGKKPKITLLTSSFCLGPVLICSFNRALALPNLESL